MRQVAVLTALLCAIWTAPVFGDDSNDGKVTIWATPHEQYSSSVGVLGCKIDTNRVAYWPAAIDCSNICVELSHAGRSVKLLRIDQSEGAYDVSYDAWNYLYTGESARDSPAMGGQVEMQYRILSASACADLLDDGALPLSAPNSMNFLASCLDRPDSWVSENYVLYNVLDSICSLGRVEECTIDWPAANQPDCPNMLGEPVVLTSAPVHNIQYGTGELVLASSGEIVEDSGAGNRGGGAIFLESHARLASPMGLLLSFSLIFLIYPLILF
ncbi:hypothetical protein SODALDRAFT_326549 [Sodiomyces alkalinus F11]|uniref:Cerato-platanin n=1 Tax=Sodiomyces alkalinus (strain CBS 110278 / VKM F-3762 / F11) TaxID=1314773 RepID=A0A3N2Q6P5_SODAK|nr:hypothetical protein SODALDRAFT_326549 [Sodiomyces alkalinus F11]ROT42386.1 hypothetical protein SODALDRAFT_326549 [Sodiomyces alkalinus F11]